MNHSDASVARILVVGSTEAVPGLDDILGDESWECVRPRAPTEALRQVRRDSTLDLLILIPVGSADGQTELHSYTELCRDIKLNDRTALLALIFVLGPDLVESRGEIYQAGADDCILLPAYPTEIRARLSNALRVKRATDSLEDSTAVTLSLAAAIEGRDAYTHGHVERVSAYCIEIGRRVGVSAGDLGALKIGGVVHDIGKVSIPDAILNKPGRLDEVEMELIKSHCEIGYNILQPLRSFRGALPIVRWHHERPNGKGYPDGLTDGQLPLLPRIVAVADFFDAISTARPYRPALPLPKCREILSTAAENGDLDPSLVAVLFDILGGNALTLPGVSAEVLATI